MQAQALEDYQPLVVLVMLVATTLLETARPKVESDIPRWRHEPPLGPADAFVRLRRLAAAKRRAEMAPRFLPCAAAKRRLASAHSCIRSLAGQVPGFSGSRPRS